MKRKIEKKVTGNPHKFVANQNEDFGLCATEYSYTWVVNQFDVRSQKNVTGIIESPILKVCNVDTRYEFKLKLYPSVSTGSSHHLRIHIENLSCSNDQETSRVELCIINATGDEYKPAESNYNISKGYKCPSYSIDRKEVYANNLLSDHGTLTVRFRISFYKMLSGKSEDEDAVLDAATALSKTSILDEYEELLNSSKFSDVTIVVGDKKFPAHRNILATRSPVFSAMFEHEMLENKENIVEVTDVKPDIMAEVLRFIYADKVNNVEELAADLLVAADKYQLKVLRLMSEEVLVKKLKIDNVLEILKIVDLYASCRLLRDSVLKFLTVNGKEVANLENFDKIFGALSPALLTEVAKTFMTKF